MTGVNLNMETNSNQNGREVLSIWQSCSALVVEVIAFIIVLIVSILLVINAFNIKPYDRGFFCDDQSLMFPYKEDTISSAQAAAIALFVFPIVAIVVEILYILSELHSEYTMKEIIYAVLRSLYSLVLFYILGLAITQSVVSMMKLSAGRLRPNFFAWCNPEYNATGCDVGGGYITDFVCTNSNMDDVIDSKQSFPSGHSSSAVYAFTYVAIFLEIRLRYQLKWRLYLRMIGPVIQTLLIIAALYICLSRIQDNKHHPTDVLGGAVVGLVFCLITIFSWSRDEIFKPRPTASKSLPVVQNSFRKHPSHISSSQNPIMQSTYSIANSSQEVTIEVPSSPL
ncbi:phospholipid phosphatase 1-like [Argopecten irradians]|uniref:phospholipid phosphatase 1-like n=1 Tax=Argopecten irradians TaxID=31199 RepID=UPI003724874C